MALLDGMRGGLVRHQGEDREEGDERGVHRNVVRVGFGGRRVAYTGRMKIGVSSVVNKKFEDVG